ncbi:MAG: type II secretion system F family protein [Dethiosulfatibacter sp.]|nr:type II secretion system F family protein [Dethiosulfatibacter sp.]
MPNFKYTAMDNKGKRMKGTFTAASANDVSEMLKEKKFFPVHIEEAVRKSNSESIFERFSKVSNKDLAVFCRQFYAMLNAGIPIINCIDIIQQQTVKKKFQGVIADLFEQLQKGYTFSEALKQNADIFPNIMINMVEAGEVSGNLDLIMERLSQHFEKEYKINNKIKSAMAYPAVLAFVTVSVVIFLLVAVMPTFVSMFEGTGVPLPTPTLIILGISDFLQNRWYVVIGVIALIIYVLAKTRENDNLREGQDKFLLKRMPILNDINTKIVSSRFTRTMSTLIGSGVELLTAIEITSRVTGNKYVERILAKVSEDVKKGVPMSDPLKHYGIFPPMIPSMIKIGEDSGSLDNILDKTANFYDDELDTAIQKLTSLVEPIMIVFMGVIVGFIVVAMMMPMFDMLQTVK